MVFIYRQEILKDISLFTSQPKAKFYDELFLNLDLSCIPAHNSKTGRTSYSNHAMICAFIVMKCEGFSQISDLHDFLSNNLIVAYYCGFDITKDLPSYAKFTRFIREFDNDLLQTVMQAQVLKAHVKSIAVLLKIQKHLVALVIINAGITARKTVAAPNMLLFLMITDLKAIDRQSIAFKSVYALRTEAERYNSRFKQAGCERIFVRNGNSTKNLNTIAHISLLSIAITAVITKKSVSYRSTKSVKRIA